MKPADPSLEDSGRVQSVTDFTRRVKELLKGGLPPCWVQGEVSNLRAQASGHVYFSLKDAGAQLSCVMFRGDAARQAVKLRDGLQVLVYGEVDVYEARGQYQLITRALIEHGTGRLQQEFEQLKQRLAAEGLFDADRKQPLPLLPRTVGFITSPTGAAVQDFIRILQRRRWTGRLVVLPAKVQGEGAAAEMAALLRTAEALGHFDLLVIGRGGGSIEDLWAFNEESLVRAVAACGVPIISAVGHEIDYTLCDFAADVRAETPSGAAELISSHYLSCVERLDNAGGNLDDIAATRLEQARQQLDHLRSRLRLLSPTAAIEQNHLRLDDLRNRLAAALRDSTSRGRQALVSARTRLASASPEKRVQLESHRLLALWKRLESASPQSVLKRGYAIVRDEQGRPVARAQAVKPGQPLVNEFHDGQVRVRVE
ncbi:exodeoxyribonuclease VII large subunit [Oleiharenicola lentus]|uniref:Exodeoxyribonuclease 7 large subunit n=1 Tax=Oleiharenicola lentus TaxID=2508720 RepID=A0A4Q1C4W5_9BACT|nr:exodeoxyribonuclease VII large subunit [Oleiharenicola lentus]RXK53440.1 exodeoxyribonuclease VII large subunit [Oleiharenicola lentus]